MLPNLMTLMNLYLFDTIQIYCMVKHLLDWIQDPRPKTFLKYKIKQICMTFYYYWTSWCLQLICQAL